MEFKKNAFVRKALPWVLAAVITAGTYGVISYCNDVNKSMEKSMGELSHGLYSGGDNDRN